MGEVRWFERQWSDWLKLPKYWHLFSRRNWTLQDLYDRVGLSPKLQTLLAGQSGDYALPPKEIALITHTSLVWDYSQGAYYPKYHFKHFVDTIAEAVTEGGGVIIYSTPIEQIKVKDGKVESVRAGGETYQASKAYISDLDPKLAVKLMREDAEALSKSELERLTSYEYSTSAFNIYLGLDRKFDPQRYGIGNWNVWYYPNGKSATFGNNWYYPNGRNARFGSSWYYPNGKRTNLTSLLSWSCGVLGQFNCQGRLADLQTASDFWYHLTVIELSSRAYAEYQYNRQHGGHSGGSNNSTFDIDIIIK